MRIAVVSLGSPFDVSAWSGIPYHVLKEVMRRHGDVAVIDTPLVDCVLRLLTPLRRIGLLMHREPWICWALSRLVEARLRVAQPDVILAINAEHKIVALGRDDYPIVLVSDVMFSTVVDYYPKYRRLSRRTRRNGNLQQSRVLERVSSVMITSDWAARSAAANYGRPVSSFAIVPFGANFDAPPAPGQVRLNVGPLKLLFVGFDWRRKGGQMVLDVFSRLRRELSDAELHIVGCRPPEALGLPGVICHGRLSKASSAGREALEDLFRRSSFFLMPSRQEAFGVVYCEACAFGLPPVAMDTGGVGAIIASGVNGLLLSPEARAEDYARAIMEIWRCERRYREMQIAARTAFETRLSWQAWGDALDLELERAALPFRSFEPNRVEDGRPSGARATAVGESINAY
jgi:glycosyltransferase involved in cell wall biosynthesis